jgi:hypothetical protein
MSRTVLCAAIAAAFLALATPAPAPAAMFDPGASKAAPSMLQPAQYWRHRYYWRDRYWRHRYRHCWYERVRVRRYGHRVWITVRRCGWRYW